MAKRPITPEDIWKVRRVGQPEPLPDGSAAVVPVTTYDVEADEGTTRLYLVGADRSSRALTRVDADSTAPAVDPGGERIAFLRRASKDEPGGRNEMMADS